MEFDKLFGQLKGVKTATLAVCCFQNAHFLSLKEGTELLLLHEAKSRYDVRQCKKISKSQDEYAVRIAEVQRGAVGVKNCVTICSSERKVKLQSVVSLQGLL